MILSLDLDQFSGLWRILCGRSRIGLRAFALSSSFARVTLAWEPLVCAFLPHAPQRLRQSQLSEGGDDRQLAWACGHTRCSARLLED